MGAPAHADPRIGGERLAHARGAVLPRAQLVVFEPIRAESAPAAGQRPSEWEPQKVSAGLIHGSPRLPQWQTARQAVKSTKKTLSGQPVGTYVDVVV
jgi:hypothetical protein